MTLRIIDAHRDVAMNDLNARLNAGAGPGKVKLYGGTRAVTKGTLGGTLLVEPVLGDPAFGASIDGVITANDVTEDEGLAAGTPTWFVATDSDDNFVFDGTVGIAGSGADLIIGTANVTVGGVVDIINWTISGGGV